MRKTIIYAGIVALLVSLITIGAYDYFTQRSEKVQIEYINSTPEPSAKYTKMGSDTPASTEFTEVAEKVMNAVVHIRSTMQVSASQQPRQRIPEPFRDFFGEDFFDRYFQGPQQQPQPRQGTGSGVIITQDGYVVTNNHVVAKADEIDVTLFDNRSYKAKVVGTDPTTDLAVLQIKENDLPTLPLANSNNVKVGEWVLAVGNPFNLNSTVTAGIVSATGRSINIFRDQYAIESFIQTDAAINPGNSGGALVNMDGGLIGINTAIASPTGSYSGYGFAVPSNIANKVIEDLIQYGTVRRGYLGVMIRGVNSQLAEEENLDIVQGVYVDSLLQNSAAAAAGIQPGDVIVEIEGRDVNSPAGLQEVIAQREPGDQVEIIVNRNGNRRTFNVTLKSREEATQMAAAEGGEGSLEAMLGASFENVSDELARELGIEGGVMVTDLRDGKLSRETKMREGFIIIGVDGQKVTSVKQFKEYLRQKGSGGVLLEGVYENYPGVYYYGFGMDQ